MIISSRKLRRKGNKFAFSSEKVKVAVWVVLYTTTIAVLHSTLQCTAQHCQTDRPGVPNLGAIHAGNLEYAIHQFICLLD